MKPKYQAIVKFIGQKSLGYFEITFAQPIDTETAKAIKTLENYPGFFVKVNLAKVFIDFNPCFDVQDIFEEIKNILVKEEINKVSFGRATSNTVYKFSENIEELFVC